MKSKSALLLLLVLAMATAVDAKPKPKRGWLGLGFTYREGRLQVCGIQPNGPADKAGLQVGDRITHIDGRAVRFRDEAEAIVRLRAVRVGAVLGVTVVRGGRAFDRRLIPIPSE